jgi:hypothetical protein
MEVASRWYGVESGETRLVSRDEQHHQDLASGGRNMTGYCPFGTGFSDLALTLPFSNKQNCRSISSAAVRGWPDLVGRQPYVVCYTTVEY